MSIFRRKAKKKRNPWWSAGTIEALELLLHKEMDVFEWGSGNSTIWLAKRARFVWSVEHADLWKDRIAKLARKEGVKKRIALSVYPFESIDYYDFILRIKQDFDLIIVDGRNRVECFKRALRKVKHGGYVMVDDTDRPIYGPIYDFREVEVFKEIEPDESGKKATIFRKP